MKTTSRVGQGPLTPLLNEPLRRIDDVFHPSRGGVKFPDGSTLTLDLRRIGANIRGAVGVST
jgi:hypothetical protein